MKTVKNPTSAKHPKEFVSPQKISSSREAIEKLIAAKKIPAPK